MRLAFVDLLFNWPPPGGAPADLYNTMIGLQGLGHDVRLFYPWPVDADEFPETDALPFAHTRIAVPPRGNRPKTLPGLMRDAVDVWRPDAVFTCFGFFMKPFVIDALAHYPLVSRYYAYELTCPRDFRLFKNGTRCEYNYLSTPDTCRVCAVEKHAEEIRHSRPLPYAAEFVAARAYMPGYYRRYMDALSKLAAIIVYNPIEAERVRPYHENVHVITGGVHVDSFAFTPLPERGPGEKKVILMTGRAEDEAKGLKTLRKAADMLAQTRSDFEVRVTWHGYVEDTPYFKAIGWHDHAGIMRLYQDADVCVVPSLWDEPFGLVAVEAMATGRPVCVSRVGGLQYIVEHGKTGYVFDRHDPEALAGHLATLLDDAELRRAMGRAGRKRVEREYDWQRVIETHYPPLLEALAR